ncbi:hypothetical protein RE428_32930 [Marinobacter nanhaiticus D15-8W]|uniref:hypothetical protein n=1 Tax=Marinobacter nanhaiticus TaxID=1305740 RepID=UPI0002CBAF24|nr:hypothetical protein RE428_32930 [Marinobacter nanhaiticus D15-8W]
MRVLTILFVLNALFIGLQLPGAGRLPWVALEALVLVGLFALIPSSRWSHRLAWVVGAAYATLTLLAIASALLLQTLGRPLNLYLDAGLLQKSLNLMVTNLGIALTVLVGVLIVGWVIGAAWLVRTLLVRVMRRPPPLKHAWAVLGGAAVGLVLVPVNAVPVTLGGGELLVRQITLAMETHEATQTFDQRVGSPQAVDLQGGPVALDRLDGHDVMLGFIESYGVSTLTDPRYRDVLNKRLAAMDSAFAKAGLHVVSGRLRSPVQGGQSWLAHATLLSGLWVDSQLDYEILLSSNYPTLIDDFRQTGHDAVAVMPAITKPWPEGRQLRYSRIYDAGRMGYTGPPLNWVTMPDQYTWSWFERQVRKPAKGPVFAELALISSHAPWVPILPVLDDWQRIGSGEVFESWRDAGETPASLWRDPERVRQHYIQAVDYALAVAADYAVRHLDDNALLVLLGDHQAAPLVTGDNTSRDVPVHLISGNLELLEPFVATGDTILPGFRRGIRPDVTSAAAGMDAFRPFLHQHFATHISTTSR